MIKNKQGSLLIKMCNFNRADLGRIVLTVNNLSSFAKVFVLKNEDFGKFARVLSVKFLPEVKNL